MPIVQLAFSVIFLLDKMALTFMTTWKDMLISDGFYLT